MSALPPVTHEHYERYEHEGLSYQKPFHYYISQHVNTFDYAFRKPTKHDFIKDNSTFSEVEIVRLDRHHAGAYHAMLRVEVTAVYSAANQWNAGTSPEPMPTTLPDDKVALLGIGPPPIPPFSMLTSNYLELAGELCHIEHRIRTVQSYTLALRAWIAKAKHMCVVRAIPAHIWKFEEGFVLPFIFTYRPLCIHDSLGGGVPISSVPFAREFPKFTLSACPPAPPPSTSSETESYSPEFDFGDLEYPPVKKRKVEEIEINGKRLYATVVDSDDEA
jgi:hypothetical protein